MRHVHVCIFSCLLLLPLTASAQGKPAGGKKLYCWEENSQRICSDALPADAINRAREEISLNSGLKTAEIERTLNEQERAQATAKATQRMLDEAKAETRRRTEQAMLTSYPSEAELKRVFDERSAIVDNNINTAQYNLDSLRNGLISLLQVAGDRELGGKPVSRELIDNIRRNHAELLRQLRLKSSFEQQRIELDSEVIEALQRYRIMTGGNEPVSAGRPRY